MTVWLEVTRTDGTTERRQIGAIERDAQTPGPDDLGLRLAESKNLLHGPRARLVKDQIEQATTRDRICRGRGSSRSLHDHRRRVVHTLFGQVGVRQPRWRACSCLQADDVDRPAGTAAGADHAHALLDARATPVRHFAVAPNMTASRPGTIRNALKAQGWLPGREVIALTDGDPALAGAVRSAVRDHVTHILDWFHISMRVRHVEQALTGLLGADLEHKGPLWLSAQCGASLKSDLFIPPVDARARSTTGSDCERDRVFVTPAQPSQRIPQNILGCRLQQA